ncbi:flagellar motor protein MotB [Roseburia sp. MSJ-14]|uniref:flagellar motor protein MotB n=1 Tax=Roseburia sp. MSJ-14 TaxID=2841514 RepID=UPI001C0FF859|nr:flagellar motor protein MotB [Roseburia sp. MSJ-14]
MARRKKEEPQGGGASWLNTFADLMNLLLCFFVLLFSMSTVDAEKFEMLVASLQNSFSIFPSGGASIGDGMMVSSGVSQLEFLDTYYNEGANSSSQEEGQESNQDQEEQQQTENDLKAEYEEASLKESEQMAESIEQQLAQLQIGDQVEVDSNAQYVMLTLNGALLFDSAKAEIREDAIPLVDKLSTILQSYNSNSIYVEGHTDNVPIHNSKYESNDILSSYRAQSVKDYILSKTTLDPSKIRATGCGEYNPIADNSTPEGRARNRRVEIKIYNSYNSN